MRLLWSVVLAALMVSGCGGDDGGPTAPTPAPTLNVPYSATDLRVGTGTEATTTRSAAVNYTGWIYSPTAADNRGAQFDSSLSPGRTPYVLTPPWNAIQGFIMGVNGMRVGGIRRVVIPPNLGYGNNPPGSSNRPNETLLFEIELLAVQ